MGMPGSHTCTDCRIETALELVAERLDGRIEQWWLIGSSALYLHDIDGLHINDIDILVPDAEAARCVAEVLGAGPVPKTPSDQFRSEFFACKRYDDLDIEIMGGFRFYQGENWQLLMPKSRWSFIRESGMLYAPDLNEMCDILRLFGRRKDQQRLGLIQKQGGMR